MINKSNWIKAKNNEAVDLNSIPVLDIKTLREEIISCCATKNPDIYYMRPVGFFGKDWGNGYIKLFVVLADDKNSAKNPEGGTFYISSTIFSPNAKSYESLTPLIPSFHIFEREFFEEFNIKPLNHPWLKPLRKNQDEYPFFEMEGEEIHQVAVGPIHAGVIEPGHFRFMCNGETVYHLEIALGYQHKGVEELMIKNPSNQLAESISGDSVIAYNLAYSTLFETLKNIQVSNKAQLIRILALEMERAAVHIGDLGAISGDIAYLMGASVFGATRTLIINTMLEFSGSRFGRGLITLGGVNFDIDNSKIVRAIKTFNKVEKDVKRMVGTMLKNSTVMSRLEKTGTISTERAKEIGLVGMAARSAGVNLDTRFDFPNKWIEKLNIENIKIKGTGDVNARFKLRFREILQSFSIIRKVFEKLKEYSDEPINNGYEILKKENLKDVFVISAAEGWRGEVIHIAMTNNQGALTRYKIKDPSFNNWYGLALAVRNNGISDFPLCNKSFNLSYSGYDL